MSRTTLGIEGSSRLRRVLGLGLSGAALAGLVYFEGVSAQAEEADAQAAEALDDEWDDEGAEADEDEAEVAPAPVSAPTPAMPAVLASTGLPIANAPTEAAAETLPAQPVLLAQADIGAAQATAETLPTEPEVADLVVVPDLKGMSLRKARRELAAVGLKLSVRDEWGDKVPREVYGYYKVRTQKIEAGTKVEPGSRVRVKAREKYQAFQGY